MTDFQLSISRPTDLPKETWGARVKSVLQRFGRPMSLSEILDELAKTSDFEGCQDPLHNLRGVCAKGAKEGWLTRIERGVFQLTLTRRNAAKAPRRQIKAANVPRTQKRAKTLQIIIGDVTLRTPMGMRAETLTQIVRAIREA